MPDAVRIDRWLWAVRLYKTRSQAGTACRLNQVSIGGQFAKPARPITAGTTIQIEKDLLTRTIRVLALTDKRIAAKLVPEHFEALTPQDELERARAAREQLRLNRVYEVQGEGRPSKKQRREIEKFLDEVKESDQP